MLDLAEVDDISKKNLHPIERFIRDVALVSNYTGLGSHHDQSDEITLQQKLFFGKYAEVWKISGSAAPQSALSVPPEDLEEKDRIARESKLSYEQLFEL